MKYTLIVTHGRSGSTLLQGILNAIDGWQIKGENFNFAYHLFKSYQALTEAKETRGDNAVDPTNPWYGCGLVDLDEYENQITRITRSVLHAGLADHVTHCGFKEVRYFEILRDDPTGNQLRQYLDFLCSCFKSVRLIFLTRDSDSTAQSGWWRKQNKQIVVKNLDLFHAFSKDYCELNPENTFHITYDDIVLKSARLGDLFAFIEASPKPEELQGVMTIPHSYDQRSINPTSIPKNSGSLKRSAKLNEADRFYALRNYEAAKASYSEYVQIYEQGEADRLPFYAAVRAGYQAHVVRSVEEQRLAYFPVPKCACTAVSILMYEIASGHPFEKQQYQIHKVLWKSAALSLAPYKDYFKFTVVRDPIERFISGYRNRIVFHKDLSPLLRHTGEKPRPDINSFALRLDEFIRDHIGVATHFQPQRVRLSSDLSLFDMVYPIERIGSLVEELSMRVGRTLHLGRYQDGGPKMSVQDLSEEAFEKLLCFFAPDYELLRDFYPQQRIKNLYRNGR